MDNSISFYTGKIHFTASGKGTPVVLLHGYLETSKIWEPFTEKLGEDFIQGAGEANR